MSVPELQLTQGILVTSTFDDMHAEREHLHKVVFPELQRRLAETWGQTERIPVAIELEPVDVRWAIQTGEVRAKEGPEWLVLLFRLKEALEREPFQIVLLGDCYGCFPPEEQARAVAEELGLRTEVAGKSVAALEIEFSVLNRPGRQEQCFFYFREPLPYDKIRSEVAARYCDLRHPDPQIRAGGERLVELKRKIERDMSQRVRRYRAQWDPERGGVTGLDEFGQMVLADLSRAVGERVRTAISRSRPNYHVLLGLGPGEKDPGCIQAAINQKRAEWSKKYNHPIRSREAQKHLELIPDIERVMKDPELREEEAREAERIFKEGDKNASRQLDEVISILAAPGYLLDEQVKDLARRFGQPEAAIRRRVKVPIRAKEPPQQRGEKRPLPPQLAKEIADLLALLGKESLYDLLGVPPNSSLQELQRHSQQLDRKGRNISKKTAEAGPRQELASHCLSIFKTEEQRAKYDTTLDQQRLEELRPLIEAAGSSGRIPADMMEQLLLKARERGVALDDARRYIAGLAAKRGWLAESPAAAEAAPPPAEPLDTAFADEARADVSAEPLHPLDENVQFSVYRPGTIRPEKWYVLLAFAHLSEPRPDAEETEPDPIEEVQRQARVVLEEKFAECRDVLREDSRAPVPHEGELTFVPEIPGVRFNPPRRSFFWVREESVHREEFQLQASADMDGKTARGRLTVFLGSRILADVALTIRVDSGHQAKPSASAMSMAFGRPYRRIFASYSHQDVEIVEEFERYFKTVGDEYLRDWIHLRAGEVWSERLEEMIQEADVFQLFWSANSMGSRFVRQEWEYALSLGRPHFVRPVYWEEPMPNDPAQNLPPEALLRLHFQRLPVAGGPPRSSPVSQPEPAEQKPRLQTSSTRKQLEIRPNSGEIRLPSADEERQRGEEGQSEWDRYQAGLHKPLAVGRRRGCLLALLAAALLFVSLLIVWYLIW